ncbi:NAD(P)/FAD-dependent oxidoreductase [Ideonella livida]|uniref:FAD-dependent oxidoreductase n=1 Tax=Ideonella livida TaxID=2707176 RepID=A0A7C9TMA4_9BURK|nr:NAD(P)/FAD-dependent oxidoreductase [Ideonella livida]NDY92823.1 FAD-dependent oxidoreductase [Ideonella livida]
MSGTAQPRRRLLRGLAAAPLLPLAGCATAPLARARVVVVGGGLGGATAAKYLRLFSDHRLEVVLVEPRPAFVSCPVSNLVLAGWKGLDELTVAYDGLARHGVQQVRDRVGRIDPQARTATLAGGATLRYDRLVLAPGIDFLWDEVDGLRQAHDAGQVLHAWQAGPETLALRRQLQAMPDGGVFALAIPEAPYRCPPGPYERACLVAAYLQRHKPRAKVLVLDANPDLTSKAALFRQAWRHLYGDRVEYLPQHRAVGVDAATGTLRLEVQAPVRADVLNVLPPMRAGALAVQTGLATAGDRWCPVRFLDFASTVAPDIHVLGDALQAAPGMPKSGHMANAQAKVAAAAIVMTLAGRPPEPQPLLTNVCLSQVDEAQAIHVASVHAYDTGRATYLPVPGAGGLSDAPSTLEGRHAEAWARNIWRDSLG